MLEVFTNCKLLRNEDSYTQQVVFVLIKRYVQKDLKYVSDASRSDRDMVSRSDVFTNLVTSNSFRREALPSTLQSEIPETEEFDYIVHQAENEKVVFKDNYSILH